MTTGRGKHLGNHSQGLHAWTLCYLLSNLGFVLKRKIPVESFKISRPYFATYKIEIWGFYTYKIQKHEIRKSASPRPLEKPKYIHEEDFKMNSYSF